MNPLKFQLTNMPILEGIIQGECPPVSGYGRNSHTLWLPGVKTGGCNDDVRSDWPIDRVREGDSGWSSLDCLAQLRPCFRVVLSMKVQATKHTYVDITQQFWVISLFIWLCLDYCCH